MSEYLLNIAARSAGSDTNEMLPLKPAFNGADAQTSQAFNEENNLQDGALQNQFIQQRIIPAQPVTPQKIQQAAVINEMETGLIHKNIGTSYFSKHVERVESQGENNTIKNKASETLSFKIDERTRQAVENIGATHDLKEPVFSNKIVLKTEPEKKETKKQVLEKANKNSAKINPVESVNTDESTNPQKQIIQPAEKNDEVQNKKINLSENLRPERIIPNQPEQMKTSAVQNGRKSEPAPKLIIGKIIVEILPPKLPVPQKVITRVVQSTSNNSFPKTSKLSFGLGQL